MADEVQRVDARFNWVLGLVLAGVVFAVIGWIEWRRTPTGLAGAGVSAVTGSIAAERENVKAARDFQSEAQAHESAARAHAQRAEAAEDALAQVLEAAKTQAEVVEASDRSIEEDRPEVERLQAEFFADPDDLARCQSTAEHQQGYIAKLEQGRSDALELRVSNERTIANYKVQTESLKQQVFELEEIAKAGERLARKVKRRKLRHGFGVVGGPSRALGRQGIDISVTAGYGLWWGR